MRREILPLWDTFRPGRDTVNPSQDIQKVLERGRSTAEKRAVEGYCAPLLGGSVIRPPPADPAVVLPVRAPQRARHAAGGRGPAGAHSRISCGPGARPVAPGARSRATATETALVSVSAVRAITWMRKLYTAPTFRALSQLIGIVHPPRSPGRCLTYHNGSFCLAGAHDIFTLCRAHRRERLPERAARLFRPRYPTHGTMDVDTGAWVDDPRREQVRAKEDRNRRRTMKREPPP
jgi:hypothetical protein